MVEMVWEQVGLVGVVRGDGMSEGDGMRGTS